MHVDCRWPFGTSTKGKKGKKEYLYSAFLHQGTYKALRHGSHSFTCKQHHAYLSFVSVHQMAPPQQLMQETSNCSLLLTYRPQKDERLSWPGWLICSGWFTHLSGHPSATGRARTAKARRLKADVVPLDHATNRCYSITSGTVTFIPHSTAA